MIVIKTYIFRINKIVLFKNINIYILIKIDMIDIIGFTTDGVHVVYGNGRTNDFEIRGGSTLKLAD